MAPLLCWLIMLVIVVDCSSPPNFLIFFIDDLEYTESWSPSIPSHNFPFSTLTYLDILTPNINTIMNEGIVFPRTYAGAPMCSPSRYSLLTGRYSIRSEYAINQTLTKGDGDAGTRISIKNSRLWQHGHDSVYNLQSVLKNNGYYTGQTGKWHLMTADDNGHEYGCCHLDIIPNETLYNMCTDIVKTQGFDFVDGYYHENIKTKASFRHNPEWMVQASQKFIDESVNKSKPFFLYYSSTLAHLPSVTQTMLETHTNRETPKGLLSGDDIPNNTGMVNRSEINRMTINALHNNGINEYSSNYDDYYHMTASTLWIDDALGAILNHLKLVGLYNNTFIVVMNDHGVDAKGTLFEHGARIFQYIRYPPLFGTNGHILSDDFIVSNYDLAAVIFNLSKSNVPSDYVIDGKDWLHDVLNEINNPYNNDDITCCNQRYLNLYNSHGIVTKNNKYIFRATNETWPDDEKKVEALYPSLYDIEQIYKLNVDPTEQENKINSMPLKDTIFEYKAKMVNYIQDIACIANNINQCIIPNIEYIPGYSCKKEIQCSKTWIVSGSYDENTKLTEAEQHFLSSQKSSKCGTGMTDFVDTEYVFQFQKITRKKLKVIMMVCCASGKSFGSKYKIWPSGWKGNDVYNNNNYHNNEYQVFVTNNTIKKPLSYNWIIISLMGLLCLIIISFFYRKNNAINKKVELLLHDENLSNYGSV